MASIWDDKSSNDSIDRLVPVEGQLGIDVYIKQITFKEAEGASPSKTEWLLVGKDTGDGVYRELPQNLLDPFSGKPELTMTNIKNYIMLFQAISPIADYDKLKNQLIEELGEDFDHKALHDALMKRVDANYETVDVKYLLVYPISKDVVSAYANRPQVGNFVSSKYRNKDLAPFDPKYMSMTKGGGAIKTPDGPSNVPARSNNKADF